MSDESAFLDAIRADPSDETTRLVYADWLDERSDPRGEFVRLHLALRRLSPDHVQRSAGEHELSILRKGLDPVWLAVAEPERAHLYSTDAGRPSCRCFDPCYESNLKWTELALHMEPQDTECDAWKKLLDLVEAAAADGREEFTLADELDYGLWQYIVTLPPTIAKLKAVRRLHLYGSHLVRIPPEIGQMTGLEEFVPYTSYRLHWFPYEITRCRKLRDSTVSTRALYGNNKYRPPFPRLEPTTAWTGGRTEPARLSLKRVKAETIRNCSVCNQPFEDLQLHRVWLTLRVATDDLPLLVNACSEACLRTLPAPPTGYAKKPHCGGLSSRPPG